jgi:hypothetical protein
LFVKAMVDRLFQPKRRQVAQALALRTAFEEHNAKKVEMLHTKRVKVSARAERPCLLFGFSQLWSAFFRLIIDRACCKFRPVLHICAASASVPIW